MKPKLCKVGEQWLCCGGVVGVGETPMDAYLDWQWLVVVADMANQPRFADDFKPAYPDGPRYWPGTDEPFSMDFIREYPDPALADQDLTEGWPHERDFVGP